MVSSTLWLKAFSPLLAVHLGMPQLFLLCCESISCCPWRWSMTTALSKGSEAQATYAASGMPASQRKIQEVLTALRISAQTGSQISTICGLLSVLGSVHHHPASLSSLPLHANTTLCSRGCTNPAVTLLSSLMAASTIAESPYYSPNHLSLWQAPHLYTTRSNTTSHKSSGTGIAGRTAISPSP